MSTKKKTTVKARRAAALRRARMRKAGRAGARGPEPTVTMAVVERIGQRMAIGLPLDYALALEKVDISEDCFHKALQRDTKLSTHLKRWKAKFIAAACETLTTSETSDLRWILLRRHPDIFAMPSEKAEDRAKGDMVVDGLQQVVNRAREYARLKQAGELPAEE
jgi:hypothetical protein